MTGIRRNFQQIELRSQSHALVPGFVAQPEKMLSVRSTGLLTPRLKKRGDCKVYPAVTPSSTVIEGQPDQLRPCLAGRTGGTYAGGGGGGAETTGAGAAITGGGGGGATNTGAGGGGGGGAETIGT